MRMFISTFAVLLLVSCGGGGGKASPEPDITKQLADAKLLLATGDVSGAEAAYTAIIGSAAAASKAIDPENAEARFGRALCNLILLIEKDPFAAMLAGFGQAPMAVSNVFGTAGYFALSLEDPHAANKLLPFNNISGCRDVAEHKHNCILSRVTPGYTETQIASSLNELMDSVDVVIADLLVAIETESAGYVIPKELYFGDADIPINHADMVQLLASLYAIKAGSDFANSWKFDMDLSTIVDQIGRGLMTKQQAVNKLNEQFGLRADNKLASAKSNLQSAFGYSKQALSKILDGASSGTLNLSSTNKQIYQELYDMVSSANDSLGSSTKIVGIMPEISADLDNFFKNPSNGAEIESDPFVLQGSCNCIKAVEAYWQQMINKACNFSIGTKGVKVFSGTVRNIVHPYYQLFNVIMGHRFGRHYVGIDE